MKLELPWPPSLNRLFRTVLIGICSDCRRRAHATLYKSQEYQDYATQLKLALLEQEVQQLRALVPLELRAHFYRPRKTGDLDNMLKALLDLMSKTVYPDDSQIVHIDAWRHDDKTRPRVELEVTELATEQPQQTGLDLLDVLQGIVQKKTEPPKTERRLKPVPPPMPQSLEQRLRNLARPATITHRSDE